MAVAVDGATATVRFTVAPADLTVPMHLPSDTTPAIDAASADPAAAAYVARWLTLLTDRPCAPGPATSAPDPDRAFVVVTWRVTCQAAIVALRVDLTQFFAADQRHEAIVTLGAGAPAIVRASQPIVTLSPATSPSLVAWIGDGMHHIFGGRDHVCFVLALLLVLVLTRAPDGGWQRRPLRPTLVATARIVTAFTIAHSLSLIAASLGWIRLPAQLVESAIAISIAYTAVEDVVAPDVRWRFALAFGFGLVHGLGFASALEALLPPDHIVTPLLLFNLGVELGQLTIVLVALPVLWFGCRVVGAVRYRHTVMPGLAAVIFVLGIVWLIERLAGISIFGS
ncbi:MAG: HupE/UreJ family protein [Proteobacteria bacterium]|nr:HupE/UreJ family protein [Pseudomonadota bacterium]